MRTTLSSILVSFRFLKKVMKWYQEKIILWAINPEEQISYSSLKKQFPQHPPLDPKRATVQLLIPFLVICVTTLNLEIRRFPTLSHLHGSSKLPGKSFLRDNHYPDDPLPAASSSPQLLLLLSHWKSIILQVNDSTIFFAHSNPRRMMSLFCILHARSYIPFTVGDSIASWPGEVADKQTHCTVASFASSSSDGLTLWATTPQVRNYRNHEQREHARRNEGRKNRTLWGNCFCSYSSSSSLCVQEGENNQNKRKNRWSWQTNHLSTLYGHVFAARSTATVTKLIISHFTGWCDATAGGRECESEIGRLNK